MFVLLTIQDKIKLHPKLNSPLINELDKKYAGSLLSEGVGVAVSKILETKSYQITDGFLICECVFELVIFKFIETEVLEAKITRQEEDCIKVSLPFFDIRIDSINFMDGCEKIYVKYEGGTGHYVNWVWNYEGEKYYFTNNEEVRVRIVHYDSVSNNVYGSFNGVGLGPTSWWL